MWRGGNILAGNAFQWAAENPVAARWAVASGKLAWDQYASYAYDYTSPASPPGNGVEALTQGLGFVIDMGKALNDSSGGGNSGSQNSQVARDSLSYHNVVQNASCTIN
jgi:hypothetical protein